MDLHTLIASADLVYPSLPTGTSYKTDSKYSHGETLLFFKSQINKT
jgi:hypothetical protein